MCDCVNPVLATLVDLICPHVDQNERTQKKNDDWAVAPPVGQPLPPHPQAAAPARLNYRKHFNQYLELHKQNPLETTFRRPVADLHSGLPFPTFPYNKDQPLLPHPSPDTSEDLAGAPPLLAIHQEADPDIEEGLTHPHAHPQHAPNAAPPSASLPAVHPLSPHHQLHDQPAAFPPAPAPQQPPPPEAPAQHRSSQPQFWGQPLVTRNQAQADPDDNAPPLEGASPEIRHVEINFFELRMGQVIGEGGFGKVYYGEWRGVPVAVKVMSTDGSARASVVQEFCREVHTMTHMPPHPNILRLLAASTRPPNLALVTEYCSQGSLYALLHSPAVYLSWGQVIAICLAAARGMAHLHAHHVLHRDLKSGNLLVTSSLAIKVADFGLARVYQDLHTMTGGLGTYQWMAPEVLANQRYSEKADVYSFGVVAWECCARQVPYAGLNGMQAAMAVMNKGLRPEIPRHTPEPLAALIRRCWAAVPEQRPLFPEIVESLCAMQQQILQAA